MNDAVNPMLVMSRLTFPDTPMSAEEVARSIRREQGRPERPDPNEMYEVEVQKTICVTIEASDEDDAELRYLQGGYSDDEDVIEQYVVSVTKKDAS